MWCDVMWCDVMWCDVMSWCCSGLPFQKKKLALQDHLSHFYPVKYSHEIESNFRITTSKSRFPHQIKLLNTNEVIYTEIWTNCKNQMWLHIITIICLPWSIGALSLALYRPSKKEVKTCVDRALKGLGARAVAEKSASASAAPSSSTTGRKRKKTWLDIWWGGVKWQLTFYHIKCHMNLIEKPFCLCSTVRKQIPYNISRCLYVSMCVCVFVCLQLSKYEKHRLPTTKRAQCSSNVSHRFCHWKWC